MSIMDCNKEEAIRAKKVAEKRMQAKDFIGAQKIALRAQQLYPDLENITQLLTVCEVHLSAERRVLGSEMDWYRMLQVAHTADEASMKKQYRRLALLLHPDKNKFEGAEAAFKLVGEAHRFLSDPAKRPIYDIRYKTSLRTTVSKQPQQQQPRNPNSRKQSGVSNNHVTKVNLQQQQQQQQQQTQSGVANGRSTFFTKSNLQHQQQQTQSGAPDGQATFWTACPSCSIRYQYFKSVMYRSLRCQRCFQPFTAYDMNAQGVQQGDNWSKPADPQQNGDLNQSVPNTSLKNNVQNNTSRTEFQGPGCGTSTSEPFPKAGSTAEVGQEPKSKRQEDRQVDTEDDRKGKKMSKFEEEKLKTSRKRGRNFKAESSERCDLENRKNSVEDEIIDGEDFVHPGGDYPRRSVRQKQNVTYNEDLSDDDFMSPLKRSDGSRSSDVMSDQNDRHLNENVKTTKEAVSEEVKEVKKEKGSAPLKENMSKGSNEDDECKQERKDKTTSIGENVEQSVFISKSLSNGSSKRKPDPEFFVVPDSDFYDFDKDRKHECFANDQVWAVYDNIDGMPRFYARIRKVFSCGFKVRMTWLEADPGVQDEIDWFNEELPISCGKFKNGHSEVTEDINMFSHLVFEKCTFRGSCQIYPKMGETWALFRNWDIKWSSDPENHRNCEFEFVVVLSDYAEGSSLKVAYLVKLKGFTSLFGLKKGIPSSQIPSTELLRFSHRVPSYKTTGSEREGLSQGYFELDPASLPEKIEGLADLKDVEVDTKNMDPKTSGSCSKYPDIIKASLSPSIVTEDQYDPPSPSSLDPTEIPNSEFFDFEADKTPEKFQPGQIWALYCEFDGMPKFYARINKISPPPDFELSITWLEPDQPPRDIIQWFEKDMPICCGIFRSGETKVFTDIASFSHLSVAKPSGTNRYEIRPRKGEIWALYKNFNSEWTCSDLVKCEYDLVEIIENNLTVTKVVVLELVDGFDTVFRALRNVVTALEIPQVEIFRFSHKVPAFQLTAERDGSLKGFWELDPKSMPYCLFHTC